MSRFLKERADHLTERMDDPDCRQSELFATYRQFSHVNSLISRWKFLFRTRIAPLVEQQNSTLRILDIGCGGGDICLKLSEWAGKKNACVEITGIDPDPRALEYARTLACPDNVTFRQAYLSDLTHAGEHYDVIISNHLLHHLTNCELATMCEDAAALEPKLVIFNDISRSATGFYAFGLIAPLLYRSSFIVEDGLTSIRRSFTGRELKQITPDGWQVNNLFPYRLLLTYETG